MTAVGPSDASAFLDRLAEHERSFYRAVVVARAFVPLSLGLLIPAQRELHGDLFPLIVALWVALCAWVLVTSAYAWRIFDLLKWQPRWLWIEEAIVIVLLVGGGGFRNVFYFYGCATIVLGSLFGGARMAFVLATVNSAALAVAFGSAQLVDWDAAIEDARFTEWWGAIVGYYVAAFLFAYVRLLFDRLRESATAYRDQAVRLEEVRQEAAALRARRDFALSARELEVLVLVAEGLTNRAIGERLFLAEQSVKNHVRRVCDKLGAPNRTAAAAIARRAALLEPD